MPEKNENTTTNNLEPNTVTSETSSGEIVQLNSSRDIDLTVGILPVVKDGVTVKVPAFGAAFMSSAFFRAVCENLEDVRDGGFTIDIRQDAKTMGQRAAEKILEFNDWKPPTYTLLVRTRQEQEVQMFDEMLVPLKDKIPVEVTDEDLEKVHQVRQNIQKSVKIPIYQFFKDGFDGYYVENFVNAVRESGHWILVLQDNNTKEQAVWWNHSMTYHAGPAGWGAQPTNRQARRNRHREKR